MFKKLILLIAILFIFISLPLTFASDVNNDTYEIDDNSQITGEIYPINNNDDILTAGNEVYFNASALKDGDGSKENPYKIINSRRINEGSTIYLANGEYDLSRTITISSSKVFIGENPLKTIINQNNHEFSVSYGIQLSFNNLTLLKSHVTNDGATLTASNVIFSSGTAKVVDGYDGSFGGAISCFVSSDYYGYYDYYPTLTLDNCTFINNTAVYGGAIYMEECTANIADTIFENNYANNFGGAIVSFSGSVVIIENTVFNSDYSKTSEGGAIYITESRLTMNNSTITNCSATIGGGICDLNSTTLITSLIASNNRAVYEGGAYYKMYGSISISSSKFNRNSANNGGAAYIDCSSSLILRYNDFTFNTAKYAGGAIYSIVNTKNSFVNNFYAENSAILYKDLFSTDTYNLQIGSGNYELYHYNYTYNGSLPSRYSLADDGYITPLADQQTSGNCWAFASIAALESCILKASGVSYNLSEENVKNVIEAFSDYGWNMMPNEGGYDEMAIGYFTSWLGPVNESDDIFDDYSFISPVLNSLMHVQNVIYLGRSSYTDNDAIKEAILKYGAVATGIYYDSYYLSSKNGYYYSGNTYANHAVTIIGWDDNYSKNNFLTAPKGNGAWIVKNSWGESWGDHGYFYVSYYDGVFAKVGDPHFSYTFILNDTIRFDKNYQYDIQGTTDYFITGKDTIWYENIFTATDNELLSAFSTYFNTTTDWEAQIYVNNDLKLVQNGTSIAGYFTINLNQFIPLSIGDTFRVVLKISTDKYASFPISENARHIRTLYSPGVSFFSYDGVIWYDLYDYKYTGYDHSYKSQVACIKAFTTLSSLATSITVESVNTSVQTPTSIIATLRDSYANPIDTGVVLFKINNETYYVNVTGGIANLTTSFNDLGNFTIEAFYESEALYEPSNTTAFLNVDKAEVSLSLDIDDVLTYEDIVAVINLNALNGDNINANVTLLVNNKKYNVEVVNGTAVFVIDEYFKADLYNASVVFNDSAKYYDTTAFDNFTVSLRNVSMDASFDVVDVKYLLVNVTLSEDLNDTIIIIVNNSTYELNYTENNTELLITDLEYGNYTVSVLFEKEGYLNKTVVGEVELKPIKTFLITDDIVMYYKDGTRFAVTLVDEYGNVLSNRTVTISINNANYTRVTDENGTCSMALNLNSGNYSVDVGYNGTDIYCPASVSNNITILSTISSHDVVKYYRNDTQYYVTFYNKTGEVLANKTITFNINGVYYNRTTNNEGVARLNINLNPEEYIITVFNTETGEVSSNLITVLSRLVGNDLVKYYRNASQYSLKVLDKQGNTLAGRTVKLNINGVFYYRVSDENGTVRMNINLNPGDYIITAEYDGCVVSNSVKVLSVIESNDLEMNYRDGSKFQVRLLDETGNPYPNQKVDFNVNGVLYTRTSNSDGIASLNINLVSGKYIITTIFNGLSEGNTITIH